MAESPLLRRQGRGASAEGEAEGARAAQAREGSDRVEQASTDQARDRTDPMACLRGDHDLALDLICQQQINAEHDRATMRGRILFAAACGLGVAALLLWLMSMGVI
jgi:hypothetical protein